MPSIFMLGRFLPKLHSIRDSIPEAYAAQTQCLELPRPEPQLLISHIRGKDTPIAIVDLSSYTQGLNRLLSILIKKEFAQIEIVAVSLYEGPIFEALQKRFSRIHFLSIREVNTQLLPLIIKLSA